MVELKFNAELYEPLQPGEEISEYEAWKELCRRMDKELADARLEWREAVFERDQIYREMKEKTDRLRLRCVQLEAQKKPPVPKRG